MKISKKRIISLFLAFALIFTFFNINLMSNAEDETDFDIPPPEQNVFSGREAVADYILEKILKNFTDEQLENVVGVLESNDLSSITFKKTDGTNSLHIFGQPIKYKDVETVINEDGKETQEEVIKFIDMSLIETELEIVSTGNSVKTSFSKNANDGISLSYEDYAIKMTPITNSDDVSQTNHQEIRNAEIKNDGENDEAFPTVEYKNAYGDGTTLQYDLTRIGIKESIILENRIEQNVFEFVIDSKGLIPELSEDKRTIGFFDPTIKTDSDNPDENGDPSADDGSSPDPIFRIDPTFIVDSVGVVDNRPYDEDFAHITWNNTYDIVKREDGTYLLTMTADKDFLNDPRTVYPVIIDPPVSVPEFINFEDCYMARKTQTSSVYQQFYIGNAIGMGPGEIVSYVKPNFMQKHVYINPQNITAAYYTAYNVIQAGFSQQGCTAELFDSPSNIAVNSIIYDNIIPTGDPVGDPQTISPITAPPTKDETFLKSFDITELAEKWLKFQLILGGKSQSYGFVLRATNLTNANTIINFNGVTSGSFTPSFVIEYNEERKLENGTYYIRNKQYGTYFQNNGQNNNTTLSGFTGASNQQWRITEDSNNDYSYYISPMEQQHVLVTGQQMNSPPKVVFQTGGPTPGMRSRIVSNYDNTSSPDGSFRIMSVAYENLSIHAANPGTCTMYPYSASDVCRNWEFEKVQPIEDGTYYIKNVGSQKYMYASGDYIHQYANKLIANQTYVDRQHFKFVSQPNGSYHIIPLGGGYVNPDGSYMYALQANVAGDIKWDNYPVPASGYSHEFIIHQRPNGTYYIIPKLCSNRGMRVADNTTGTIATTDFISAATIHMEWQLEHKFNGGTFSMQNNGSKKYMFATNEWIEQRDRLNAGEIGIDRQRYRFIQQSSGAYHIIPLGGKYVNPDGSFQYALQANSAGNIRWGTYPTPDQNYYLEFDIQQNVNGTYYIKPGVCNNRGMRVANDAIGTKATTNLLSATNEYMEWRFEEITKFSAIVYNYYDSGFIFYLQNEHSASTPVSDINTIQQIINTKFLDEFNLNITSYNALAYTTTVDLCKRGIANFTTTNIHNRCRSTTMDIHNVQHDFCTYTSIMWSDFNPPNKGNCQTSIALWTGHTLYVDDEYEKDANGNYILDPQENKILQKLGEESNRSFIGGYYIMNSHRSHPGYERFGGTAFHELMHFFGAPDTYCRGDFEEDEDGNIIGTQCSNEICTTCYTNTEYEADCIMTTSGSYFVADSPICNKCKNDVREHLLANH